MEKIDLLKVKEKILGKRVQWKHCQITGKIRKFVNGKEELTSLEAV